MDFLWYNQGGGGVVLIYSKKVEKRSSMQGRRKRFSQKASDNIGIALSALQTASCLEEIPATPPLRRHKLNQNYSGRWALCVSEKYRLIIKPVNGSVEDPRDITSVEVLSVDDYH